MTIKIVELSQTQRKKTHYTQKNKEGWLQIFIRSNANEKTLEQNELKKKIVDLPLYTQGKYFSNKDKLFKRLNLKKLKELITNYP